jgi:hypothetical protein
MNFDLLLPLLITTLVTIIGWFVAHQFNVAQGRMNKRQELRVQYLIDAYRRLEASSNREQLNESERDAIESSLADIQLFGTDSQIIKAQQFIDTFAEAGRASLDELLSELRNDLRRELKLGSDTKKIRNSRYLRIDIQNSPRTKKSKQN